MPAGIPNVVETAVENPMIQFRDGYGISEYYTDESSGLRIGETKKKSQSSQPTLTRPYATVPYMGRGSGNSFVESQLRIGEDTV